MTDREKRIVDRNDKIRARYDTLRKQNPKWRYDAIVTELAKENLPLSERSIGGILNFEYERLLEKKHGKSIDKLKTEFHQQHEN